MYFRYDFDQKLDLSKFRKSAEFYLSTQPSIKYDFYLSDFRIGAYIQQLANHQHKLELIIEEKLSINYKLLIPSQDDRFKEIKLFQKFPIDFYQLEEASNSVKQTINTICDFVIFIHKINNIRIFV